MGKLAEVRVKLSAARHGNPARDMTIILVAGDHSETTVATLFAGIAREAGKTTTVVSHETTPGFDASVESAFRTLARVKKTPCDFVIIEATERFLSLGVTSQFTIGTLIFTSNYAGAEALLRQSPRHVVAPSNLDVPEGLIEPYKHISYGEDESAEAQLVQIKLYKKGTELSVAIDHQIKLELATHLVGKTNAINVVMAAATAYVLGFDTSLIQEGIADIEVIPGNFTRVHEERPYSTYYDAAATAEPMLLAMESARQLAERRLIVVASVAQLGDEAIARLKENADRLVLVLPPEHDDISGTDRAITGEEAVQKGERAAKQGDLLLVFGVVPQSADSQDTQPS